MSEKDYLDEDVNLKGQNYVCISFLVPDKDSDKTITGIKIRGTFPEYKEACEYAKKLQSEDKYFDVFVGEMGKWLPFNPKPDSEQVRDYEYETKELNEIMKGYKKNQEKAKLFHEQRKTFEMKKNVQENLERQIKNKEELTEKLNNENLDEEQKSLLEFNLQKIEDDLKEMNKRKEQLEEQNRNVNNKLEKEIEI